MEGVLRVAARARDPVEPEHVRFVVCEQRLSIRLRVQAPLAELVIEWQVFEPRAGGIVGDQADGAFRGGSFADNRRAAGRIGPTPDIPEPEMRKNVQRSRLRSTV